MTKIAGGCHKLQEFITNHSAFQKSQVPEYALIMSLEKEKKKKKRRAKDCSQVLFE